MYNIHIYTYVYIYMTLQRIALQCVRKKKFLPSPSLRDLSDRMSNKSQYDDIFVNVEQNQNIGRRIIRDVYCRFAIKLRNQGEIKLCFSREKSRKSNCAFLAIEFIPTKRPFIFPFSAISSHFEARKLKIAYFYILFKEKINKTVSCSCTFLREISVRHSLWEWKKREDEKQKCVKRAAVKSWPKFAL